VAVAALFLSLGAAAPARAVIPCANRDEAALPGDAYYVSPSAAIQLPALLRQHHRVQLAPGADYRRSPRITLQSNEAIYGAAGTRTSAIIVTPGTHDAIVSGVVPDALEFPASDVATSQNCFERFAARTYAQQPLTLKDVVVENNLFLDVSQVFVDTSRSGRVANNRFIRTLVHGASPVVVLHGSGSASEDRNVFLWMNVLGPIGDAVLIDGESQVNIIGLDAENWNQHGQATRPAMLSIADTRVFRGYILQGGAALPAPTRYLDVSATAVELAGVRLYKAANPAVRVADTVSAFTNLLPVNVTLENHGAGQLQLTAFENGNDSVTVQGADEDRPPQGQPQPQPQPQPQARGVAAWEAPRLHAVSEMQGRVWQKLRATAPDSREYLQHLIDTANIAVIPAGTYYISGPLALRNGQGIVGAGADRTTIVAKSADLDLIVGADHYEQKRVTSFSLIDVTLQGGRVGIRHDEGGAGKGAQFNLTHLSHVVIRDMTEAGISISGIYGWDNNLIDNVTFYRMPVGIRQTPSAWYVSAALNGDVEGMNYMDKNVFYRCQFDEVGIGMELTAKRANGLNACVDCVFRHNRLGAMRLTWNVSTVVANSDFIANGGDPVIASNLPIGIVASRFVDGTGKSFLDSDAICEGCRFLHAAGGVTTVGRDAGRVLLVNSESTGVPLGRVSRALMVNSSLRETAKLQAKVAEIGGGASRALIPGLAQPAEQLLRQW
jgi:hypothetical protein